MWMFRKDSHNNTLNNKCNAINLPRITEKVVVVQAPPISKHAQCGRRIHPRVTGGPCVVCIHMDDPLSTVANHLQNMKMFTYNETYFKGGAWCMLAVTVLDVIRSLGTYCLFMETPEDYGES